MIWRWFQHMDVTRHVRICLLRVCWARMYAHMSKVTSLLHACELHANSDGVRSTFGPAPPRSGSLGPPLYLYFSLLYSYSFHSFLSPEREEWKEYIREYIRGGYRGVARAGLNDSCDIFLTWVEMGCTCMIGVCGVLWACFRSYLASDRHSGGVLSKFGTSWILDQNFWAEIHFACTYSQNRWDEKKRIKLS